MPTNANSNWADYEVRSDYILLSQNYRQSDIQLLIFTGKCARENIKVQLNNEYV